MIYLGLTLIRTPTQNRLAQNMASASSHALAPALCNQQRQRRGYCPPLPPTSVPTTLRRANVNCNRDCFAISMDAQPLASAAHQPSSPSPPPRRRHVDPRLRPPVVSALNMSGAVAAIVIGELCASYRTEN